MCFCVFIYTAGCVEPRLQVWVQAAGVWGAPCTCCTEVGGWVSRLGSCDGQWELFGTRTEEHCESPIFLFIHNWTYGYQEYKAFTRVLTVPWEVVKCTPLLQFRMEISPSWTKIEGSVSPAVGHFFPSLVHPPLFTEIKSH